VPPPPYTLYSPAAVGLATFLGSPLAGTVFMAINYRRLGKTGAAVCALVVGLLATVILVALGVVTQSSAGVGIGIAGFLGTLFAAKALQGPTVEQHQAAGGKIGSTGIAAVVGLLFLGIVFGAIYLGLSAQRGTRLAVGINEIYYKGTATQADAQALGKALENIKVFDNTTARTVFLSKSAEGTVISFVVVDPESVNKPEVMPAFAQITATVGPAVGGTPLKFRLVDSSEKELKSQTVDLSTVPQMGTRLAIGPQEIYYKGTATEADAKALGKALEDQKYFDGKSAKIVFLAKSPQGTIISFVVSPADAAKPANLTAFAALTAAVGPAAGGKPLTCKLVDPNMKELNSQAVP